MIEKLYLEGKLFVRNYDFSSFLGAKSAKEREETRS
jgi:hypothetical protein